jgi:hypothetical protein
MKRWRGEAATREAIVERAPTRKREPLLGTRSGARRSRARKLYQDTARLECPHAAPTRLRQMSRIHVAKARDIQPIRFGAGIRCVRRLSLKLEELAEPRSEISLATSRLPSAPVIHSFFQAGIPCTISLAPSLF